MLPPSQDDDNADGDMVGDEPDGDKTSSFMLSSGAVFGLCMASLVALFSVCFVVQRLRAPRLDASMSNKYLTVADSESVRVVAE